ncbi:glycoside hydrolase family 3 protein [Aquipseudomonas campi]|uniref:beta-N-acetylhexosaminidase n=1 Tax=Aquipseudomonas campi TaxID=2731681 RepID=A0A6M8FHA7_9GAMM|nr:glycoside hydrolase family 3 protein [Pseudomonas campi]QKE63339.1 glycoside hydrolase family 3 protein [Pseudomonas campi]
MRKGLSALLWLATLLLAVWAWNLKDPHLLALRPYESALLIGLCLLLALLFQRCQGRLAGILGVTVLLGSAGLSAYGEWTLLRQKAAVHAGELSGARVVGAHLLVGYSDLDELRVLVGRGMVAGVFITRRNLQGKTLEQLQTEIGELQQLRHASGLPPLLIASDQEGGLVSHLSPLLPQRAPLASLLADSPTAEQQLLRAEQYGAVQGAELARLGINLNFSPVVDIKPDTPGQLLDFHSRISQRAIASDPGTVSTIALGYSRGLQSQGVLPTLKHFPGLGGVSADTHHFSANLDTPLADLSQRDWRPFREVAGQTRALIMLGHVVLSAIDPDNLVATSPQLIEDLLRSQWQHQGVLITDDLTMAAAYNRGLCTVAVGGLNAGVDLLLVSYDHEKVYPLLDCLSQAYAHGTLDQDQLQRSAQRLAEQQRWLSATHPQP